MSEVLLIPGYFAPIDQFCAFFSADKVRWEMRDNYQKQTYRTRQYIYGANGRLMLNIPIKHTREDEGRQQYGAVEIENKFAWQRIHWESLKTAYNTSPFFEFYRDEFKGLYFEKFTYLRTFNFACWEVVSSCLGIRQEQRKTEEYIEDYSNGEVGDYRDWIIAKREENIELQQYSQVFYEKSGFLSNLSVLDLLFNKGPRSLDYLEQHRALSFS